MLSAHKIYTLLASGTPYSTEHLSEENGISLSAVEKQLVYLKNCGLEIETKGNIHRLPQPLELLSSKLIHQNLTPLAKEFFYPIETWFTLDSTQDYGCRQAPLQSSGFTVFAEHQSAARGRAGRLWLSPLGGQLACSILWKTEINAPDLSGLSLVVGIGVVTGLSQYGIKGLSLKWPNDIILDEKKCGGILIDVPEKEGPTQPVIIGIGINTRISSYLQQTVDQPITDLGSKGEANRHRNQIAALILNHLVEGLSQFEISGFKPFLKKWHSLDFLFEKSIEWRVGNDTETGVATGVTQVGELLVKQNHKTIAIQGSPIQLRIRHAAR